MISESFPYSNNWIQNTLRNFCVERRSRPITAGKSKKSVKKSHPLDKEMRASIMEGGE